MSLTRLPRYFPTLLQLIYTELLSEKQKGGATLDWLKGPDRGLLTPDLVLYLDLLPKDAASRGGYGEERYENIEFQEQVRSMFLALKAKEPSWIWMDANRDRDSIAMDVQQVALETIQKAAQLPLLENLWL